MWFLKLIPFIGNLFSTVNNLTDKITALKIEQLKADTDQRKLELQAQIDALALQRDLQVKQDSRNQTISNSVRIGLTMPFGIYIWKLVVYDKVLEWGSTDNLSPDLWYAFWMVMGYWFLTVVRDMVKR